MTEANPTASRPGIAVPQNVSKDEAHDRPWRLQGADRVLIRTVFLALFLAALEQTIVGPALPAIGRSLGDTHLLPWVATGYLLAATAMGPIFGSLADQLGRRPALMLAIVLFVIGSVGAAAAPSMPVLIGARIVQGAGAAGLVSLPFVVVADIIPIQRRAAYSAAISTLYAVASIGGPPLGGALTQYMHWSVIFWLNLPIGLTVLAVIFMQREERTQVSSRGSDIPGALLLLLASTVTIQSLESIAAPEGPQMVTLLTVAIGVLTWTLFGWRMRKARTPLLPVEVLTEPTILFCTLGLLFAHGANVGLVVYLPLYYQQSLGMTPAQSGVALLGFVCGVAAGAYVPAVVLDRTARYKALSVASSLLGLSGAVLLMVTLATTRSLAPIELATAVLGLGLGGLYPTFTIAAQNATGRGQMGATTGLLSFMRSMGGAIGVMAVGLIASSAGLTREAARIPVWLLAVAPFLLLLLCFVMMAMLPPRRLGDNSQ